MGMAITVDQQRLSCLASTVTTGPTTAMIMTWASRFQADPRVRRGKASSAISAAVINSEQHKYYAIILYYHII